MKQQKILFLDRDGTLIVEPEDKQVDCLSKLEFMPNVFPALLELAQNQYRLVMVTNQDGLGTPAFTMENFTRVQNFVIQTFASQGIHFDAVLICPHYDHEHCHCRKPKLGLLQEYLVSQTIDREFSYVIGDRNTDLLLAENLKIKGIQIGKNGANNWREIADFILNGNRAIKLMRNTNETNIELQLNLSKISPIEINTGIGFFNHLLEQLAKHGGFSLQVNAVGDLHVDEHHTVEDTAIVLGQAFKKILGDKYGINRYGFVLPMDEALTTIAIDLCGRYSFDYSASLPRENIGGLSTELIKHFFQSFAENLQASLHLQVKGENCHHMIESMFKGLGRCLQQAVQRNNSQLPSTKGLL